MIKAVLFDLNHTLVHRKTSNGVDGGLTRIKLISDSRATKEWLASTRKKYFFELTTGAITDYEYWTLALAELEIKNLDLVKKLVEIEGGSSAIYPDALPAIKLLREKGFLIGILANSSSGNEKIVKKLLEKNIDAISYSHVTGFRKPHKNAYLLLCSKLKVEPEECVFVSDEIYEDLWGAKRLGMKTAWIKREKPEGFYLVDPSWRVIEPDYESTSLEEIAKQIRQ